MRYKHIATIGTVLITFFVLLAALVYYFNQDHCSVGEFRCKNSTQCIPQRNWCNEPSGCPEGEDEHFECFDATGNLETVRMLLRNVPSNLVCPRITENDLGYYKSCDYMDCSVKCMEFPLNEIPETFSDKLTTMIFQNSSFPSLRQRFIDRYRELRNLVLQNNGIKSLERGIFSKQENLVFLTLSNNRIEEISRGHLIGLESLRSLRASNNSIHTLDLRDLENNTALLVIDLTDNLVSSTNLVFPFLPRLRDLNLDQNRLESITDDMFFQLPMLSSLTLKGNFIRSITPNAFKNLIYLNELILKENMITTISDNLFKPFVNISKISIGYNLIQNLPVEAIYPLKESVVSLGVEDIGMRNVEKDFFNGFRSLEYIYFTKFHYCTTYAPKVKVCLPVNDGVSSLSNLLDKSLLRAAVWGISCVTCLGNALVLWGRLTARDENRVLSIVIRNLAVSDLLMGLYLFIIGLSDIRFRNNYNQEANGWISSWSCTLIGMLAMTSSEVSVLILSFMSVERFMLIAAPLKGHRAITPRSASSSMIVVWILGVALALIPVIHWRGSTRFYGLNGMCFPLHIEEPFLLGWEYSAFIFLGVNLLGLITIGYVYVGMFVSIWRTRHATPLSVGDFEFALRFFFIVLTDAVCWSPIIILKSLALAKHPVAPDLHAWVVIFILPINSAVNPLLYTFTTPKFRERLNEGWFGKIRGMASNKQSRSGSQTSGSYNNKGSMLTTSTNASTEEKPKQLFNETLLINFSAKN